MKMYPVHANLVDIFAGDGWYNWSRWRCIKNHWIQIGGPTIPHPALIIKQLSEGKK